MAAVIGACTCSARCSGACVYGCAFYFLSEPRDTAQFVWGLNMLEGIQVVQALSLF